MLRIVHEGTPAFDAELARLERRGESDFERVEPAVREILAAVRAEGDAALLRYAERFDRRRPDPLVRDSDSGAAALARLPDHAASAMRLAADRIRAFHARQLDYFLSPSHHAPWLGFRYEADGISLGVRCRPLERAGIYAPGGKARYPSSVLMSAIPAQVAGVKDIVLATPLQGDATDDAIFAAAHLSGVTRIVDSGGAQAIAALAYGTESVPRVDKIVGPGNLYVACAKRFVFGAVAIDSIAGPSEILVVADDEADPRLVAADLLSQAEHDEAAYPLLVCASELMASAVSEELARQLESLPRVAIARASVTQNGVVFVARSRARMASLANTLAPEHLSLQVRDPEEMLAQIPHAGAVFLGPLTPEAAGDYVAGPSHVLPTGGTVRFGSPLGVLDFFAHTSLIMYSAEALAAHRAAITDFARLEGLEAHARAVEMRLR
ncbi:MAG TPA: histidinol dehydrogenase [Polyangiaceae bacterium]|nr:histidinol dehydrogenase [Polyangiaceae bacterium]